jgi:hypothetical protein
MLCNFVAERKAALCVLYKVLVCRVYVEALVQFTRVPIKAKAYSDHVWIQTSAFYGCIPSPVRDALPCNRAKLLNIIDKLLRPTQMGMKFWHLSGPDGEKASSKHTAIIPLAQETWQLSPSNLAALLQARCTCYGIGLLLPAEAIQEGGCMCVTLCQEHLTIDPRLIKKPWVDIAAKELVKSKLQRASMHKLKLWKKWCKQLHKLVRGEFKPLLPTLLEMCTAAYTRTTLSQQQL